MNEESFTAWLAELFHQRGDVVTGPGDDAAVLDLRLPGDLLLLAAADQLILDKHYTAATSAADAARKLLNRNISDIAAMGGTPTHALTTAANLPLNEPELREFYAAMEDEARKYDISIIGGDLAALPAPGKVATLTILGVVQKQKLCLRSAARPGDYLYCTGVLGNSFNSGHHLHFQPRLRESAFLAGRYTRAMMDISDGLLKDSARFAAASGVALRYPDYTWLPLRDGASAEAAFCDGEDYELLFAAAPALADEMEREARKHGIVISRIGIFTEGVPGTVTGPDGRSPIFHTKGYDHFL